MPSPVDQTPNLPLFDDVECQGYYIFEEERSVTTGIRYNRSDELISVGNFTVQADGA
jgi:hypothetical protein